MCAAARAGRVENCYFPFSRGSSTISFEVSNIYEILQLVLPVFLELDEPMTMAVWADMEVSF